MAGGHGVSRKRAPSSSLRAQRLQEAEDIHLAIGLMVTGLIRVVWNSDLVLEQRELCDVWPFALM